MTDATSAYIAGLKARCPPGSTRVLGDCLRPRNNNMNGARMATDSTLNGAAHPAAGIGHNSDAFVPTVDDVHAEVVSWMAATAPKDVVDRRSLKGINRIHAHRKAELVGLMRYYRAHPRSDVAPGVFSLIVLTSDNDEHGASFLSVARMARLLSRTIDAITDAIHRLVAVGAIEVQGRAHDTPLRWPRVGRAFADKDVSIYDIADVLAPARRGGRPLKNTSPLEAPPVSGNPSPLEPPGVSHNPSPLETRGGSKPPGCGTPKPLPPGTPPYISKEDITKQTLSSASADGASATENLFSGGDPDQSGAPSDRAATSTKGSDCKPKKLTDADIEAGFLEWYRVYPRKEAPRDAKRAYTRILKSGETTIPQLLAAVKAYKFAPTPLRDEKDYRPHPATWLNGVRWQQVDAAPSEVDPEAALREFASSPEGQLVLKRRGPEKGMERLREILKEKKSHG